MGYRLNRLDEPVLIAVSKLLLTEFGIHHRLESCGLLFVLIGRVFLQRSSPAKLSRRYEDYSRKASLIKVCSVTYILDRSQASGKRRQPSSRPN